MGIKIPSSVGQVMFPKWGEITLDTISMGLSILYFKGSQVESSKLWCISVPESCFIILANSVDPDIMCISSGSSLFAKLPL